MIEIIIKKLLKPTNLVYKVNKNYLNYESVWGIIKVKPLKQLAKNKFFLEVWATCVALLPKIHCVFIIEVKF